MLRSPDSRRNVLEEVLAYNAPRKAKRVRLKLRLMAADVFSFFRATNHLFAADWAELKPPDPGPDILVCGDLHLENFGAYRTDGGDFLFDVNDFDEAVVAPCAFDTVRCTTSILLASEMWRLSPLVATNMALEFLDRYRAVVTAPPPEAAEDHEAPHAGQGPIWKLLGEAALASQAELLDEKTRIGKRGTRRISRDARKYPRLSRSRAKQVSAAVERYGKEQKEAEAYTVLDVAGRIAGLGSLGARRYLALVEGGGTPATNRLFDIKEVYPSVVRHCTDAAQPKWGGKDEACRVVGAQRVLQAQPAAGLNVIPLGKHGYRIREMIPEENRPRIDRFHKDPQQLLQAIELAGHLTGSMHLRGARFAGKANRVAALRKWATGPALDSVLASAARYAERSLADYQEFYREADDPRRPRKSQRRGAGTGHEPSA
jgi:uncharacterized protein (DUF2252 family)